MTLRKISAAILTTLVAILSVGALTTSHAMANETVWTCGQGDAGDANNVWAPAPIAGITTRNGCGSQNGLDIHAGTASVTRGQSASWSATAPSGLVIVLAYVPRRQMYVTSVNDGNSGYGGGFFWDGGGAQVSDRNNQTGFGATGLWTHRIGFKLVCGVQSCAGPFKGNADLTVDDIGLQLQETQAQTISSGGLYAATGWVRGTWPMSIAGDSPSGVCQLEGFLGNNLVIAGGFPQNVTVWHQCNAAGSGGATGQVDTTKVPDGPQQLTIRASDAAQQAASRSEPVQIDNQSPSVTIAGPADAPSTAGVQYLIASGHAGPSGVSAVGCSLDGAPALWIASSVAQIPVSGVGVHHLTCYSANNAKDPSGSSATSAPTSLSLSIRQPSVASVSFSRIVDALRCRHVQEVVKIPARWVVGRAHGRPVRVRLPSQSRRVGVVRCHARYVRRRVRVNGHPHEQRIVVLPHRVQDSSRYVRYGRAVTVRGWLGTTSGQALGGQDLQILTAPDDGSGHYAAEAHAVTGADGSWSAQLPAGPSRLVRAVYAGSTTSEPSISGAAHVLVRAAVKLAIDPSATHWGGRIEISGRLLGGHVPRGGELVVLRIGWSSGSTEIGHVYARAGGHFQASYRFLRGNGHEIYRLWAVTAREGGYPYQIGASPKIKVSVGP